LAFKHADLNLIGFVNGFSMLHYKSEDHSDQLEWSLYFTPAKERIRTGDMVICNCPNGNVTVGLQINDNGVFSQRWGK